MEQQRNNDPNKQKILQHSVKRPLIPAIHDAIKRANEDENFLESRNPELEIEDEDEDGNKTKILINQQRWYDIGTKKSENKYKLTEFSKPPILPDNEIINPQDVYTDSKMTAYEILQGLESTITEFLKGVPQKPDYNELVDFDAENKPKDEAKDDKFDGSYIDVRNFSLVFKVALQDLDDIGSGTDSLLIHVALYSVPVTAGTYCKLVKFTRLRGDREPFNKVIKTLGEKGGQFLSGIDGEVQKAIAKGEKELEAEFKEMYAKCFPDNNESPQEAEYSEV